MKINKPAKSSRKITLIIVATLLIGIGGYAATAAFRGFWPFIERPTADDSSDTNESGDQSSTPEDTELKTDTEKIESQNTDIAPPMNIDETTGKNLLTIVASDDIDNNMLYIRGGINNASLSAGSCIAVLHGPDRQTIRESTPLLQNAHTTDCKTIQIPISRLSPGVWRYQLTYESATAEGYSSENTIEIK